MRMREVERTTRRESRLVAMRDGVPGSRETLLAVLRLVVLVSTAAVVSNCSDRVSTPSSEARAAMRLALFQHLLSVAPASPARDGGVPSPPRGTTTVAGRYFADADGAELVPVRVTDAGPPGAPTAATTRIVWIDRFEVTRAQYAIFASATGRPFPTEIAGEPAGAGNWSMYPMSWVRFEDARAYARWAGRALPWEEEWVAALVGGDDVEEVWRRMDAGKVPGRIPAWGLPETASAQPHVADFHGFLNAVGHAAWDRAPSGCEGLLGGVVEFGASEPMGDPGFRAGRGADRPLWIQSLRDHVEVFGPVAYPPSWGRPGNEVSERRMAWQLRLGDDESARGAIRGPALGFRCVLRPR
jgi:hypothetical protein